MTYKVELIKKLKDKGVKLTPQRIAIMEFIKSHKSHPSVEDIYKAVKNKYSTMSLATVYSTLELLKDIGEIQELSIRCRCAACFDNNPNPHHHLLCRKCEKIFDIDISCPVVERGSFKGYKIDEVQAYFYGLCPECVKRNKKKGLKSASNKEL